MGVSYRYQKASHKRGFDSTGLQARCVLLAGNIFQLFGLDERKGVRAHFLLILEINVL
jgi:hypothetical protein